MSQKKENHPDHRHEEKLAVALASSCRAGLFRRRVGSSKRGAHGATAVSTLLLLLALLALAGVLREFVAL